MNFSRKLLSLTLSLALACTLSPTGFATSLFSSISQSESQEEILENLRKHVAKYYYELSPEEQEQTIWEIYQEKYIIPAQENNSLSLEDNADSEDSEDNEAYEQMMEEETYIVDLINSMSDQQTTLDNWKYNLSFLQEHYTEIMALPDINVWFVNDYIDGYSVVLKNEGKPDEQINFSASGRSSYNASAAKSYALQYYKNYNPNYPDWGSEGGDCANFVSQCVHAGGKPMKGTPGTSSAADDWSNWFSSGTSLNTKKVSSTWRGAAAFRGYWEDNASASKKFSSVGNSSFDFGYIGDAVSILNTRGRAYHTLLIIDYDGKDFILAAHSGSTISKRLSSYNSDFVIYHMR